MIKLNRVGGEVIYVNPRYIESFEPNSATDTMVKIHNGTTYVIHEKPSDILNLLEQDQTS
jgi:uncharacterized protein YlzI (FlbEa/FlbD family)